MNLKEQIRHSIPAAIVVVIGAWVMIYYSIVQWETMKPVPSWDLAIFSELAKAYAHFQTPIVPVKGDGYNLLGDHFHPILILLGPIWRLFPTPLSLLITQDLLLAFSAWPLTRLASRLTKQWVAFVERRWGAVTAWSVPLVLVKEDMGLTVLMIGVAVILTSAVPAWYRSCTVIRPSERGADGLNAAAGNAPKDEATRNRHRGLRLGVGMIVGGIAAFLFAIQVFLPAFNINGVWDYGLSSQDQPTSPNALTQKATVVVMLILTSGIIGVTSPWLLVVLPTLAWRFLGSVEFYWVWDNWHYNATLMPIALGALLDVVARRRAHGSYVADHPVRQVGVDGRAVMGRSARAALAAGAAGEAGEAGTVGESDVDGPRRRPTAFPTWLTVPMRHRFVVATSILTTVATGVLTAPYLPLWQATNKNFDPLAAEAKQSDEAKRTETHRVAVAHEAIATIPEGATVVTDLSLLAYLVPRAEVSWVGTSGPDKEYIVMTPTSANQWGTTNAATWGEQHSKQGATYTVIFNKDNYQIAKRNG